MRERCSGGFSYCGTTWDFWPKSTLPANRRRTTHHQHREPALQHRLRRTARRSAVGQRCTLAQPTGSQIHWISKSSPRRAPVAIPAKEEAGRIGACLLALASQTWKPDAALLLANGCSDWTVHIAGIG